MDSLLTAVPWQAGLAARQATRSQSSVSVAATVDDPEGLDVLTDVPRTFAPVGRGMTTRRVRHLWVTLPTGHSTGAAHRAIHDPFELLGW